ncbi:hypothetical protein E8E11_004453 [Didymella keratinophila]|nr:hypothetical protein E8E11_004453 [Didymella keratinophila]
MAHMMDTTIFQATERRNLVRGCHKNIGSYRESDDIPEAPSNTSSGWYTIVESDDDDDNESECESNISDIDDDEKDNRPDDDYAPDSTSEDDSDSTSEDDSDSTSEDDSDSTSEDDSDSDNSEQDDSSLDDVLDEGDRENWKILEIQQRLETVKLGCKKSETYGIQSQ